MRGMIEVVVVDNDAVTRSGDVVVAQMASAYRFPLRCLVEPRRGHTYAYNRAFVTACRAMPPPDYVAVLDDDEYPHPNWLTEMIGVARSTEADIVGGPVFPVFDAPDHWLARSGLLRRRRYKTGPVEMIYGAGNMLIRRGMLEHYLDEPFDHAFAFTGGSDYDFFWRCRKDGRSFAWADDAHVFETTPRSRTTVGYLLRRRVSHRHRGDPHRPQTGRNRGRPAAPLVQSARPDRPRHCLAAVRRAAGRRDDAQPDVDGPRRRPHRGRIGISYEEYR